MIEGTDATFFYNMTRTHIDYFVEDGYVNFESVDYGLILPRMSTTSRNAIPTPIGGQIIYNTSTNLINYWNGSAWRSVNNSAT